MSNSMSRFMPKPFIHMPASFFAACFFLLALPAHAGLFEDDEARKAILELRTKNEAQDRLIEATRREIDALRKDLDAKKIEIDTAKRSALEQNNALSQNRDEIAKLRGQTELLGNELAKQQRASRDIEAALDARLKKLEPRTLALDGKETIVDRAEESAYNAGLNQFKAGDYKSAAAALANFIAQYPQSPLNANAQFWLGSSHYANRDPKAAIATLQALLQKFPEYVRAPDTWLTLGNAQADANDKRAAEKTYQYIVAQYPTSQAADIAKDKLPKVPVKAPPKKK